MKHLFFPLLVFFFLANSVFSANSVFPQISLGIKSGYNSSLTFETAAKDIKSYSYDKFQDEIKNNYHFGLFFNLNAGRIFIQPEFLYLKQNRKYEIQLMKSESFESLGKHILSSIDLNMFEFPILIGLQLFKSEKSNLSICFGPRFRLQSGSSIKFKDIPEEFKNTNEFSNKIKEMDIGLALGLSVKIKRILFDLRYNANSNIYEGNILKDLPSSNLVFSLGYMFF